MTCGQVRHADSGDSMNVKRKQIAQNVPRTGGKRDEHAGSRPGQTRPAGKQDARALHSLLKNRVGELEGCQSDLQQLLNFEGRLREPRSLAQLYTVIADEGLSVLRGRQIFVFERRWLNQDAFICKLASHVGVVDQYAPFIEELGKTVKRTITRNPDETVLQIDLPATDGAAIDLDTDAEMKNPAFVVALKNSAGFTFAALVIEPDADAVPLPREILERLAQAVGHARLAIKPCEKSRTSAWIRKSIALLSVAALILLACLPVPYTVLALVELISRSPQVIVAPIDGVVERLNVLPNDTIETGQPVFEYETSGMLARLEIAKQKYAVAETSLQTARQNSFGRGAGLKGLASAKAELKLARIELTYAQAEFDKSIVRAKADGVAIFNNASNWQGRPVRVGEAVLQIADPGQIEAQINVAVADMAIVKPGAEVRIFLDVDPLTPLKATLEKTSYRAEVTEQGTLAFRTIATLPDRKSLAARIGARGTAQIMGPQTLLGYYLLRRPISALRQWTGW